jgi:hypothetical protein
VNSTLGDFQYLYEDLVLVLPLAVTSAPLLHPFLIWQSFI